MLGVIVIAAGLAAVISSPFWGRFADLSSRKVLMLGGAMGAITGISALLVGLLPSMSGSNYIIALVFVLLGISEAGVLLGRKTYLIDRVDPQQRSTFVAFANSAIGLIALLFGALGIIAQAAGIKWLIGILVLLGASGSLLSYFLPEITAAPNPSE